MSKELSVVKYVNSEQVQRIIKAKVGKNSGEFASNLLTISQNSALVSQCDPKQLLTTALQSTLLNLSLNPNLGESYIVPFKKKGQAMANFIVGYKGIIQLALRTGKYRKIIATEVREGEMEYNKFSETVTFNDQNPDGDIVGYYAKFELLDGFEKSIYWTVDKIKDHADRYSQAYQRAIGDKLERGETVKDAWKYSSPWYTNFEAMAKKTILLRILKEFGPKSVEMRKIDEVEKAPKEMRETNQEVEEQQIVEKIEEKPVAKKEAKDENIEDIFNN